MIKESLIVLFLGFNLTAVASDLTQIEKNKFCLRNGNHPHIKTSSFDPANQMAFRNRGGAFNGGVCWWHSFLQRSSLYLAAFKPDSPKPKASEVRRILSTLKANASIAIIPGYADFQSFTKEWEGEIQKFLDSWQIEDAVVYQEWAGNLGSPASLPPDALRREMEKIYTLVMAQNELAWVMVKLPGIPAHAWVVNHIDRDDKGMTLSVLDSNHPGSVRTERYNYGSQNVITNDFGAGLPYLRHNSQLAQMDQALKNYCN